MEEGESPMSHQEPGSGEQISQVFIGSLSLSIPDGDIEANSLFGIQRLIAIVPLNARFSAVLQYFYSDSTGVAANRKPPTKMPSLCLDRTKKKLFIMPRELDKTTFDYISITGVIELSNDLEMDPSGTRGKMPHSVAVIDIPAIACVGQPKDLAAALLPFAATFNGKPFLTEAEQTELAKTEVEEAVQRTVKHNALIFAQHKSHIEKEIQAFGPSVAGQLYVVAQTTSRALAAEIDFAVVATTSERRLIFYVLSESTLYRIGNLPQSDLNDGTFRIADLAERCTAGQGFSNVQAKFLVKSDEALGWFWPSPHERDFSLLSAGEPATGSTDANVSEAAQPPGPVDLKSIHPIVVRIKDYVVTNGIDDEKLRALLLQCSVGRKNQESFKYSRKS
jgi:hypothetical protein